MTASMPAAPTGAMPKSPQIEIQCIWIRPLVLKPQTKKVTNRTQNVAVREASRSATSGEVSSVPRPLPAPAAAATAVLAIGGQAEVRRLVAHQKQHRQHARR